MSTINTTNLKNPSSGSNNIVLGADGSTTIPTISATTITGTTVRGGVISGTAVASTSGVSIDFTGIPSWVKRITVMFNGVSTNGTSAPLIQIGAGSFTTSGYLCVSNATVGGGGTSGTNFTSGFGIQNGLAANVLHGQMTILNVSSNAWNSSHSMGTSNGTTAMNGGGSVTLSGTLDRVRITTTNGTDTFDAGSINILYEG